MYLDASAVLGRQARVDLAREMFLAAFGPDFSERRHAELDRLLDAVPEAQRTQLLNEIVAAAQPDQRDGVVDYIAASRHASGQENLGLRTVAAIVLASEENEFSSRTSRELAIAAEAAFPALRGRAELQKRSGARSDNSVIDQDIITHRDRKKLDTTESPEIAPAHVRIVFKAVASNIDSDQSTAQTEIEGLLESHQAELEQERQEQERLRRQVRERNAELAANREESRLELRQDMLLVMAELLQAVPGWNSLDDAVRDVEAGMALALGAGGAELLESPGQQVEYDVLLHNAEGKVNTGDRVRVVAPGVIYRGGMHGDRVLLKAQVKHEAG